MAANDVVLHGDLVALYMAQTDLQGKAARIEKGNQWDMVQGLDLMRPKVVFDHSTRIINPEMIVTGTLTNLYAGGNGLRFTLNFAAEQPQISGVARIGVSVEALKPNTAGNTYQTNRFGPEVGADYTIDTTAPGGELVQVQVTVAAGANNASLASVTGAGGCAALEPIRIRIRRLNTHANDTAKGPIYLLSGLVQQAP